MNYQAIPATTGREAGPRKPLKLNPKWEWGPLVDHDVTADMSETGIGGQDTKQGVDGMLLRK